MKTTFEGRVAIVTGSGRGIGRAIALKLASEGAAVVVNDLDPQPAMEVAEQIRASGGRASVYVSSVTAPGFGKMIVQCALDEFGGLDIIVNNAGFTWDNVIQKMTDEQWDAVVDCHLKAPFDVLRAAYPHFRKVSAEDKEAGRDIYRKVVNISSIGGTQGKAGQVNYAAAKAGVIGLTKTLAQEWARLKVNVNCVAFAYIQTRMTEAAAEGKFIEIEGRQLPAGVDPVRLASVHKEIPFGRGGTVEEAAGAVYMLCIPEANYVTGQTVICGGGRGGF